MPKASTQDGLDEAILEASLTTLPTRERSRGKLVPLLRFVPSRSLPGMGQGDINIPSYHPQPVTIPSQLPSTCLGHCPVCCFPYSPFSSLPQHLPVYLPPAPPTCLPPCQAMQQLAPSLEEKELPILGCCPRPGFHFLPLPPAIFPCPLPTPHTKATHTHTCTLPRPKPGLTLSFLLTSACRQGRVR